MGSEVVPHEDHGFFGPGSVTWKVWSYPTSLTVGFQRAVVVEELDPFLLASVDQTDAVRTRPRSRYDRTVRYFATVAFGDTRSAIKASETLVKVHSRAVGIEPVSGKRYDANDPDSQLWILLTGWHSVLYAYERYGPGRLSAAEEERYWEECAIAAELQTCDPDSVPRTRAAVREYFERERPRLCATEATQAMMDHLLNAEVMFPPMPRIAKPGAWVVNRVLRRASIATMPRWMRDLAGLRQARLIDIAIRPVMRVAFRAVAASATLECALLGWISPQTRPVAEPVLRGVPPKREEILSPAAARERYGAPRPIELWAELREAAGESAAAPQPVTR